MENNGYYRPLSCHPGKEYFLKITTGSGAAHYEQVEFLGYRPHPGELVVRDGVKARVIYRVDLFQRTDEAGSSSVDAGQ